MRVEVASVAVELRKMLELVVEKQASELELTPGTPPSVRLRGRFRPLNLPPLDPVDTLRYFHQIAPDGSRREFESGGATEFGFSAKERHFLATVSSEGNHCRIKLRLIPKRTWSEDDGLVPG